MNRTQFITASVTLLTFGLGIMLLTNYPLGAFLAFFVGGVLLWITLGGLGGN